MIFSAQSVYYIQLENNSAFLYPKPQPVWKKPLICDLYGIKRNLSSDDLLVFFAFRQPQKGGFARAVKDKGGRFVYGFISYARKILLHRITRHICPNEGTYGGYFQNNIFLSLTAQAKSAKTFCRKEKSKIDQAKVVLFAQLTIYKRFRYVIIKMYYYKIGEYYAG